MSSVYLRNPDSFLTCLLHRQERIITIKKGSISGSVQAIYVPADDLTDPVPATTFAHLDATIMLSRSNAELGIYPAVDLLDLKSHMLDPRIASSFAFEIRLILTSSPPRSALRGPEDPPGLQVSPGDYCYFGYG